MSIEQLRAAAAEARATGTRQRADRPSQRRAAEPGNAHRGAPARLTRSDIVDSGDTFEFNGVASATGKPYEMWDMWGPYIESVDPGAFAETLAQDDLDVPLVLQHDSLRRIARTGNTISPLHLSETDAGLEVRAPRLDATDPDVAYIAPKLRSGLIDEMSFAFRITEGWWSDDWTEYRIAKADIHRGDVAIVGYGANPHTSAGIRSQVRALAKLTGRDMSTEQMSIVLGQLQAVDSVVDEAIEALAAALGVPSPYVDEQDEQQLAQKAAPVDLLALRLSLECALS